MARRSLAWTTVLLALIGGLIAAEVAVRLLRPQAVLSVDRGLYAPDPPRRYRLAPGFRGSLSNRVEFTTVVSMNSAGTRGPELVERGGGRRLLGLGDSFAFGVGVADGEAWPLLLARMIGAEGANAGTPGFGVPDSVDWLEAHGLALEPDVAVLGVFLGNDLQDATPGMPRVVARDGALVVEGEGERRSLKRWLYYHSHLFALAKDGSAGAGLRRLLGAREPWAVGELRREMRLFEPAPESAYAAGVEATDRAFERFAALARTHGVRALVALFPTLPQVDETIWRATATSLELDPLRLDREAPNRLFIALCRRHDLDVIDVTAALRQAVERGAAVYHPIDRHLNARGHELAAAAIAASLRGASR